MLINISNFRKLTGIIGLEGDEWGEKGDEKAEAKAKAEAKEIWKSFYLPWPLGRG